MEIKSEAVSGCDYSRLYLDQKHQSASKQKLKFGMEEILGTIGTDRVSKHTTITSPASLSSLSPPSPSSCVRVGGRQGLLSLSRPNCDILTASSPPPRPLFPPSFLLSPGLHQHPPPPPPPSLPLLGVSPPFLSAPAMSPWYQGEWVSVAECSLAMYSSQSGTTLVVCICGIQ